MSPCERVAGVIVCSRGRGGRTRTICDVCDAGRTHKMPWRGRQIDLCEKCHSRRESDAAFAEWSDGLIARNLGVTA